MPLRTYQNYERGEREPDLRTLLALLERGWNLNWLLSGDGAERLDAEPATSAASPSQTVSEETLTIALQLASETLEGRGRTLPPEKRAQLVAAIYDMLEQGLPEAKVLHFARVAAA